MCIGQDFKEVKGVGAVLPKLLDVRKESHFLVECYSQEARRVNDINFGMINKDFGIGVKSPLVAEVDAGCFASRKVITVSVVPFLHTIDS